MEQEISTFSNLKTAVAFERALISKTIDDHDKNASAHLDLIARINKLELDIDNLSEGKTSKFINAVPIQTNYLVYDGTEQFPTWTGFDPGKLEISGTNSASDTGVYTATFTPINDYTWRDGRDNPKDTYWKIYKTEGSVILEPSSEIIRVSDTGSFKVNRLGTGKITVTSNNEDIVKIKSIEDNIVTFEGVDSGRTNLTVKVDEDKNFKNPAPVSFEITVTGDITKIPIPSITENSFVYDGETHSPVIINEPEETVAQKTGSSSAENANKNYYIGYNLKNTDKNQWEDGTITPKIFYWEIQKAEGHLDLASDTGVVLIGNTLEIVAETEGEGTISVSPQYSVYCDIEQDSSKYNKFKITGKEVGTETLVFSLSNSMNYTIPEPKNFILTVIDKEECNLSVDKDSIVLNKDNLRGVVNVTRRGDGNISVFSENENVAMVEGSDTLVISATGKGKTSIVVKVEESENYKAAEKIISVISETAGKELKDSSVDEILEIIQSGDAPNTWDVGDYTSEIAIRGRMESAEITGSYVFFILGFDHNKKIETNNQNSIHFSIGKISDSELRPVAFVDTDYMIPKDVDMDETSFSMADKKSPADIGWEKSSARECLNTAINNFYNCIPEQWREIIKSTTKYEGQFPNNSAVKVRSNCFIPSVIEIFGNLSEGYLPIEDHYQTQYQYYKNGNTKLRYNYVQPVNYWTRTVEDLFLEEHLSTYKSYYVSESAELKTADSNISMGIAPCFSVY